MKIFNQTRNALLADKVVVADTFFSRTKGLLGKQSLEANEALIIRRCNSIHTFFMRFNMDAVFIDSKNKVIGLREDMSPGKISRIYLKAHSVVELPAKKISQTQTQIDDELRFE